MIKRPLYPGTVFHRVIPNFMIQGGDPLGTGMGDPGFTLPDEIAPALKFDVPGRMAMANVGRPHTGGCQFFITEVPYPSLNGGYTIFGQVVDGQDVVNKIAHVPTGANDLPRTPVRLISVVIKREGPAPAAAAPGKPAAKAAPKK
jgi:peptidyl-prolyl cis-trans isomerase A (cyclophilin A)